MTYRAGNVDTTKINMRVEITPTEHDLIIKHTTPRQRAIVLADLAERVRAADRAAAEAGAAVALAAKEK